MKQPQQQGSSCYFFFLGDLAIDARVHLPTCKTSFPKQYFAGAPSQHSGLNAAQDDFG